MEIQINLGGLFVLVHLEIGIRQVELLAQVQIAPVSFFLIGPDRLLVFILVKEDIPLGFPVLGKAEDSSQKEGPTCHICFSFRPHIKKILGNRSVCPCSYCRPWGWCPRDPWCP